MECLKAVAKRLPLLVEKSEENLRHEALGFGSMLSQGTLSAAQIHDYAAAETPGVVEAVAMLL